MSKLNVFVVQGWKEYANWLSDYNLVNSIEEADLVIFPGGEDVHPSLYGERRHPSTSPNMERDLYELKLYRKALRLKKHIIGICRGSQFICSMQPFGRLVQDQKNIGMHKMTTFDGKTIQINSTHHQAQYPYDMPEGDYKILGWSEGISSYHKDGNDEELAPERECEIVHYPRIRGLGIQHHPELLAHNCEANIWLRGIVNNFIENTL